jgi:hypothetical protein
MAQMRLRAKAPHSVSGDGDADARIPLGGIVVGPLSMLGLRVKTLVRLFGLSGGGASHRHPLGGVVIQLRSLPVAVRRRLRACFYPGVKLPQLWHRVASLVSYLLHMTSLSPFSVLVVRLQDRRSVARSERADGPSPMIAWSVRCNGVRWFPKEARFHSWSPVSVA